jgi:hypothetical protein
MYDPGYHLFLLIVIPIVLLDFWLNFFLKKTYRYMLLVSVLLVLCGLPHLLIIPALLNRVSFVGLESVRLLGLLLLLGVVCIVLGVWGILYSRNALTQEVAWE